MKIQIEAHMMMPNFKKDRSATLRFCTAREVNVEEREILFEAGTTDELGWLLWSPNKLQMEDIPKEQASDSSKTPAQRLRGAIYILWQQSGEPGDFEVFYREKMEKLIEFIKAKLD